MSARSNATYCKLTLKHAVCYALKVLDIVAPSLMRPVAVHNIAAIEQNRYSDVQLPNADDVRQLVMQEGAMARREIHAHKKLTIKHAVRYVMNILALVAPSLMRPLAVHNIAVIERCRYRDVHLPDLEDFRRLVQDRMA
jgi:uncharacterized protein YfkK (UPF0435 family)